MAKFKEKILFIWDYYKFHIIGIALAVIVAVNLVWGFVVNSGEYACVVVGGTFLTDAQVDGVVQQILPAGVKLKDVERYCAYSDAMADPAVYMALDQRYKADLMARRLDVTITTETDFENMITGGYLMSLDGLITPADGSGIYGSDGRLYGVKAPDKLTGVENMAAGVFVNTKRKAHAIALLDAVLADE